MPKLTPKRTFLLRMDEGKTVIAHKVVKIDVTEEEHKKLFNYFIEPAPKKKGLSAK